MGIVLNIDTLEETNSGFYKLEDLTGTMQSSPSKEEEEACLRCEEECLREMAAGLAANNASVKEIIDYACRIGETAEDTASLIKYAGHKSIPLEHIEECFWAWYEAEMAFFERSCYELDR